MNIYTQIDILYSISIRNRSTIRNIYDNEIIIANIDQELSMCQTLPGTDNLSINVSDYYYYHYCCCCFIIELLPMCIMERKESLFCSVLSCSLPPEKHLRSPALLIKEVDVILPSCILSYQ